MIWLRLRELRGRGDASWVHFGPVDERREKKKEGKERKKERGRCQRMKGERRYSVCHQNIDLLGILFDEGKDDEK